MEADRTREGAGEFRPLVLGGVKQTKINAKIK